MVLVMAKGNTKMTRQETESAALDNAVSQSSTRNYSLIFSGFEALGIDENEILPRENIFTYNAWRALGRQVSKGQHGVKICTFVPMSKTDSDTGEKETFKRPKTVTVFHISQTKETEK